MLVHCRNTSLSIAFRCLRPLRTPAWCRSPCRRYASQTRLRRDSISIPVGVSGNLQLDLASCEPHEYSRQSCRKLLVYLPPGPFTTANSGAEIAIRSQLEASLRQDTILVTLNYRLSPPDFVFPTPIHDASAAFEYLTTSSSSPLNSAHDEPPQICLLGAHIGGAMAAMLALTRPNDIHAVALVEPLVDWAILDEIQEKLSEQIGNNGIVQKGKKGRKSMEYEADLQTVLSATEDLIKLRAKLFRTPSAYFDSFASPTLFLRAPGRDTPLTAKIQEEVTEEDGLDDDIGDYDPESFATGDERWGKQLPANPSTISEDAQPQLKSVHEKGGSQDGASHTEKIMSPPITSKSAPRRRKVLRRWPPVGRPESTELPHVQVFVQQPLPLTSNENANITKLSGHATLMRAQGTELVELMRKACFFGRESGYANARVTLQNIQSEIADVSAEGTRLDTADTMYAKAADWLHRVGA